MKRIPESQIRYSASPDIIGPEQNPNEPEQNPNSYWTLTPLLAIGCQ